jgi:acyl transferase domain-containing protein/acyl carrier protein
MFAPRLDGRSVSALMFGDTADAGLLDQTRYTQPALFCLEYALATLWRSWGIEPDAVLGHSIGEVVAATVAGVFSLSDAIMLVATRARLMQSVTAAGGMVAVRAPADQVRPEVAAYRDLSVAAVNGPDQCVVSGSLDSLAAVTAEWDRQGVHTRPLRVSHAFHSPLMDEVAEEFRAAVAGITYHEPEITLLSNLTGGVALGTDVCTADYWARLISAPVDFAGGMATLDGLGNHAMVEIGPGRSLINAGRGCVDAGRHLWLASLGRADEPTQPVHASIAALHAAGLPISWPDVHEGRPKPQLTLPTYGFDRRRHWLPTAQRNTTSGGQHPLLGQEVSTAAQLDAGTREFAGRISADQPHYLADHRVGEQVVFPAAGFIEVVLAAMDAVHGDAGLPVTDLRIHEALLLSDEAVVLRTRVRTGTDQVEIHSVDGDAGIERLHVTATVDTRPGPPADLLSLTVSHDERESDRPVADLYADFTTAGMNYGPEFRLIRSFHTNGEHLATAELTGPEGTTVEHLPPMILDCALQTLATITQPGLPVRLDSFRLLSRPRGAVLRSVVRLLPADPSEDADFVGDVVVYDGDRVVCELTGLTLRRLVRTDTAWRRMFYQPRWVPRPAPTATPDRRHVVLLHSGLADDEGLRAEVERTGSELSFADDLAALPRLLDRQPTDLCWFWQSNRQEGVAGLDAQCELQFTELLELARLLEEYRFGAGQRLWLVTAGGQRLPGDEPTDDVRLAAASVWGFGTVLLSEYPGQRVTLLDLPPGPVSGPTLLAELLHSEPAEFQVAYRDGVRHTRRLEAVNAPDTTPAVDSTHTYLVTGGLGDLGLLTAEVLVEHGARHLALVSRRTATDTELASVRTLLGSEVTVTAHSTDVADEAEVTALFADLREHRPPLGGVVHAAGVLSDRPVSAQDWPNMATVLRPKVSGTWLLHKATVDLPDVRFFVGFGSSSAALGQAGQANYAAGNAFLDALMHERRAMGLPGTAIDWGPWSDIGMAAALDEQHKESFARQGMRFIRPSDGRRALSAMLASPDAQTLVGDCDWTTYAATRPVPNALYEQLVRSSTRTDRTVDVEGLATLPAAQRRQRLTDLVRGTVADVLHFTDIDDIPADVTFTNLGLDSLAAVEVKNKLEASLRMSLPASITLDYPSTDALVDYLDPLLTLETEVADDALDWDLSDVDAELAALRNLDA